MKKMLPLFALFCFVLSACGAPLYPVQYDSNGTIQGWGTLRTKNEIVVYGDLSATNEALRVDMEIADTKISNALVGTNDLIRVDMNAADENLAAVLIETNNLIRSDMGDALNSLNLALDLKQDAAPIKSAAFAEASEFATAAEGDLAITAVQPYTDGDLELTATTNITLSAANEVNITAVEGDINLAAVGSASDLLLTSVDGAAMMMAMGNGGVSVRSFSGDVDISTYNGNIIISGSNGVSLFSGGVERALFSPTTNYFSVPITVGNATHDSHALNQTVADTLYADISITGTAATAVQPGDSITNLIGYGSAALVETNTFVQLDGSGAGETFYADGSGGGVWAAAATPSNGITLAAADLRYAGISITGSVALAVTALQTNDVGSAAFAAVEDFAAATLSNQVYLAIENESFRKDKTVKLVSVGDSFTEYPWGYLSKIQEWHTNWLFINGGVSGESTSDMLLRVPSLCTNFSAQNYNVFTILGGVNDYYDTLPTGTVESVYNNIGYMTDYAMTNGADIALVICQAPFFETRTAGSPLSFQYLLADLIESNPSNYTYTVINNMDKFADSNTGGLLPRYFRTYPSDAHPNDAAYNILAKDLEGAIFGQGIEQNIPYEGFINYPKATSQVGLWALYKFNDFNPTNAVDSVGTNTITKTLTYIYDTDINDYCIDFAGVTNSQVLTLTRWANTNTFTYGFWAKADRDWTFGETGVRQYPFSVRSSGTTSSYISFFESTHPVYPGEGVSSGTVTPWFSNSVHRVMPHTSNWNHFAITYDRSVPSIKIYVNGLLMGESFDSDLSALRVPNAFHVGGVNSSSTINLFDGRMYELFIYSRVLTEPEVFSIYKNRL